MNTVLASPPKKVRLMIARRKSVGKRLVSGRVRQHQRRRFYLGKRLGEIRQGEDALADEAEVVA